MINRLDCNDIFEGSVIAEAGKIASAMTSPKKLLPSTWFVGYIGFEGQILDLGLLLEMSIR